MNISVKCEVWCQIRTCDDEVQQPKVGVVFAGRPRPLVLAEELQDPQAVVEFIKVSFRPYCDAVFKTTAKKLVRLGLKTAAVLRLL